MKAGEDGGQFGELLQISLFAYYYKFVDKYGFFPNETSLLLYLYNRLEGSSLPCCIVRACTTIVEKYNELFTRIPDFTVQEFIRRYKASTDVGARVGNERKSSIMSL